MKELLLIAGIRKCGTSSLYDMIKSVPNFYTLPGMKESQIFCLPKSDFDLNFKKLKKKIPSDKSFLDGSTLTLYSSNSIRNIKSLDCKVKIIFIVRDPRKRFISAYWHNYKKDQGIENRSLNQVLNSLQPSGDEQSLVKVELAELIKAEKRGEVDHNKIRYDNLNKLYESNLEECIDESFVQLKYYTESNYSKYIDEWISSFGNENCHVLSLENLKRDSTGEMHKIWKFLNIDYKAEQNVKNSNVTRIAKSPSAKVLRNVYRQSGIDKMIGSSTLLQGFVRKIRNIVYSNDRPDSNSSMLELSDMFKEELEYWKVKYPGIYQSWTSND